MTDTAVFEEAKRFFLEGVSHYEAGHFEQAQQCFEASLVRVPGRVSTLCNLGAALIKLDRPEAALEMLDEALTADPAYADAWAHRGLAQAHLHRPAVALECQDRVIALQPDNVPAWYQRSLMLGVLDRLEDALEATERLLILEPASVDGWCLRADLLHRLNHPGEALVAYGKALTLDPALHRAWSQRGGILKDLGRNEEAIEAFQRALALGGDPEVNAYLLASLTGEQAPVTAPRQYVEALFDGYAGEFDQHLLDVLGYTAHTVLISHVPGWGSTRFRSVLDLGCGTGLCGPLVKAHAERIEGVDLSAMMIARAGALGVYDSFDQADLSDHLQRTARRHDLVVSADVFIYVGALEAVFAGVQRVLDPQGMFCFSVELADDGVDYRLTPGQRYAHSQRYLRALAEQAGFSVTRMLEHPIRQERGRAIAGLFVYLTKADGR